MAANTSPIFPLTPKMAWATLTAANIAKDGTGTVSTVATAGANAAFVEGIRVVPIGTNVPTVLRVFANNGSSSAVAANNSLWYEVTLPTATLSEVAAQTPQVVAMNRTLPAGYKLNVCLGTAIAAGVSVVGNWQDY